MTKIYWEILILGCAGVSRLRPGEKFLPKSAQKVDDWRLPEQKEGYSLQTREERKILWIYRSKS